MRLVVKSTVIATGIYLIVLAGLAVLTEYEVRSITSSVMEDTANLIGREVAASLSDAALAQLLQGDAATRQRLVETISDLSKRSNVVAAITVADDAGTVVVSDDFEIGHQLAIPAVIFHGSMEPQFLSARGRSGGKYHLFVPLVRQDGIVGYIRLALKSRRIADIYRGAWQQMVVAGLMGLMGIGVFAVLLQVRLSRRGEALARTVEASARGEAVPTDGRDEFAAVIEAAGKLGRELSATRERSSQAERRIAALANFMDVGVVLIGAHQRLEFANATTCALLGTADQSALASRWDQLAPVFSAALERITGRDGGAHIDAEVSVAGHVRRVRLEAHQHGEPDRDEYLVLIKDRDLLEAFETDMRLATQMRGLGRVYSALAHELRAPLGAMELNLELLSEALNSADDDADQRERQKRYAYVLRQELARLNRSLVAVLNQTTTPSTTRERFDLCELIRDLDALLAPQAKQQHVEVELSLPPAGVPFTGHRDRMKQALLNIAANALEAMPEGGRMSLLIDRHNGTAMVSVRDSGPGIPPDILEHIYSMYFTTKDGGTGIGLHVARAVVESHGGRIEVDSHIGRGTCVQITLPLTPVES